MERWEYPFVIIMGMLVIALCYYMFNFLTSISAYYPVLEHVDNNTITDFEIIDIYNSNVSTIINSKGNETLNCYFTTTDIVCNTTEWVK